MISSVLRLPRFILDYLSFDRKSSHQQWTNFGRLRQSPRGFGYVLDFSDATMEEFFLEEFGVEIYSEENQVNGNSKRNCLTTFLRRTDQNTALNVLRALWERREGLLDSHPHSQETQEARSKSKPFQQVIEQLQSDPTLVTTAGVEKFSHDRTLDELVSDIERTLCANKPEVAIDHLHTYCVKKITHLLEIRSIKCSQDEPLHSRFGKYRKCLESEQNLHDFTTRALKSFISLLESFNDVRNNHSLAHNNVILDPIEARFIFSSVSAMLVMLRALESTRYGE